MCAEPLSSTRSWRQRPCGAMPSKQSSTSRVMFGVVVLLNHQRGRGALGIKRADAVADGRATHFFAHLFGDVHQLALALGVT